jgi:gamma-glutamylputrescine oxidase
VLLKKELGVIENSYYEASVARGAPSATLCVPESADVCVVGGGFAGVSAALELAQRGYSVTLLEAQRIGWGASGRNGGQAIVGFGSDGERAMEKQLSPGDARLAWDISVEGLRLLRERVQRHRIDCDFREGYLSLSVKPRKSRALYAWMQHVARAYDYPLEWIDRSRLAGWLQSERFDAAAFDPLSGHLHPLKYCLGLADAARTAGVRIYENSAVYTVERGDTLVARTAQGACRCKSLVLAGNVYLGEYGDEVAPEVSSRIMPVGTYMIATERMDPARAQALMPRRAAASDTNFVLDYFRLSEDNRLLFGAGDSYSGATPKNLVARIRASMLGVFPQLADLHIPYAWGGFVDITMNRSPDFGRLGSNIYYLQGFSGHGLALSGVAGKLVAEVVAGQAERFDVFARLKHRAFPGGNMMRTPALVLGSWYYRLKDLL